jgi:hypothetical protein
MASSTFDFNQFKMDQREGWNSVAEGWKKWWQPIEKGAQKLSQRLMELAEIKSGPHNTTYRRVTSELEETMLDL